MFYDDPPDEPFEEGQTQFFENFPDWFGNEITFEDRFGEIHSMTKDEWIEVTLGDRYDINVEYGYDGIDIMLALWEEGLVSDEDMDYWRAEYEARHG